MSGRPRARAAQLNRGALGGVRDTMTSLERLTDWYAAHCDGDWEHQQGIQIDTLDNPGWSLTINLSGTELENTPFATLEEKYSDDADWLRCWREGTDFRAACGSRRLTDVIDHFLAWANGRAHSA